MARVTAKNTDLYNKAMDARQQFWAATRMGFWRTIWFAFQGISKRRAWLSQIAGVDENSDL
jgi:hypothetical protein